MKNYKKDDIVKGKVTGIEEYGVFISVDDNVTGLIHISEISTAFVRNILDYVEIGEEIQAKVLEYDSKNKRLKLSIKDFDYRSNNSKKRNIHETKSGFENLHNALDKWIEEKEAEMAKNQKKQ
jgi:general stress protein 13